ncbi:MAG: DM13 domain-containing protein [Nitrososphaeraceae archaeon]|nr:DM13 domain-containing protein [Nitrososphaeraceae archaeon]
MNNTYKVIISVVVIVGIAFGIYTISPLFINTAIDEPLPIQSIDFETFMGLSEEDRMKVGENMTEEEKGNIMETFARNNITVKEEMVSVTNKNNTMTGNLIDAGDGFHMASGQVKILQTSDGPVLRFENLDVTNGPDLYVYLATDTNAEDYVSLGRLKGNLGNQNYPIPIDTNLDKYNTVLIWCQAFSTLFGSSHLS